MNAILKLDICSTSKNDYKVNFNYFGLVFEPEIALYVSF